MSDIDKLITEARYESLTADRMDKPYTSGLYARLADALEAEQARNAALYRAIASAASAAAGFAAVIEKARRRPPERTATTDSVYDILSTADPAAVLREHDAKVIRVAAANAWSRVLDCENNCDNAYRHEMQQFADRVERGEA